MTAPFQTVFQAISYYNHCNPARAKSVNLLEQDRKSSAHDFGSIELWASVCVAIMRSTDPFRDTPGGKAFDYWFLSERTKSKAVSKEDVAKQLKVTPRTLNRYLNRILVEVEKEMHLEGLIAEWGVV